MSDEEDFDDVVDTLTAGYAGDRLPRPLRDGVLRKLDRRAALKRHEWIAQLAGAALLVAGLALLVPNRPGTSVDEGRVSAAQDSVEHFETLKREIARVKEEIRALKEELARLETPPVSKEAVPVLPAKPTSAKVTAVASEIGLVVISQGKDDGVTEGASYWIHRDGQFVAQIVIDRCDRKWSAGKVVYKTLDPRVADSAEVSK